MARQQATEVSLVEIDLSTFAEYESPEMDNPKPPQPRIDLDESTQSLAKSFFRFGKPQRSTATSSGIARSQSNSGSISRKEIADQMIQYEDLFLVLRQKCLGTDPALIALPSCTCGTGRWFHSLTH